MKVASDEIHKEMAKILVNEDLGIDLTKWNDEVRNNKGFAKEGIIDKTLLEKYIKELNPNKIITIL